MYDVCFYLRLAVKHVDVPLLMKHLCGAESSLQGDMCRIWTASRVLPAGLLCTNTLKRRVVRRCLRRGSRRGWWWVDFILITDIGISLLAFSDAFAILVRSRYVTADIDAGGYGVGYDHRCGCRCVRDYLVMGLVALCGLNMNNACSTSRGVHLVVLRQLVFHIGVVFLQRERIVSFIVVLIVFCRGP